MVLPIAVQEEQGAGEYRVVEVNIGLARASLFSNPNKNRFALPFNKVAEPIDKKLLLEFPKNKKNLQP